MKKIFSILFLLFVVMVAKAQYTELDIDQTDVLYIEGTVQTGTEGILYLKMKNSDYIGTITSIFQLPEGIEMDANEVDKLVTSCGYEDGFYKLSYQKGWEASSEPVVIVELPVNVTAESGTYQINAKSYQMVHEDLTDIVNENVYTTITVQKTAILEPQRGDYAFEAVPTCVATGATSMSIPVNFANEGYVDNISFNIEYPGGMLTTKVGKNYNLTVNKDRFDTGSDATLTVKATSGTAVSFTNAESDLVESGNGNLLTIPVTLTDVADGVYTIKFTGIKVSVTNDEADPISTETLPDYYVTVIVGQPAAQEVILYGNYNEATASAFTTALKNVAIADVTAATVEDGVKFTDVLVNEKGGNSYYTRTSANYGTTVLPLNLTTENVAELYMIDSMDDKSIVIVEAENVPANTPCIFKGTINVDGATPTLGVPSEQGLGQTTFKGTYQATEIAAGEGYYISSNGKFYADGATVRPFRGYFDGAIAGAKALQVLLEDETGIKDITDQFSTEEIYNLMGVKMNNAKKGVNIINGKKVYIK